MAKAVRTIGMIAGAVALVATGVGAFAVAGSALAATATSVATFAGLASGVASVGAQLLYKPPPARGSVTRILIEADAPQPYVMGEGYFAGVLRYDDAYGAKLKKVPNPYRFMVSVYSGAGPVESLTPWVDQAPVSGWYGGFLYTDVQLGATPEADALAPQWAGAPNWTSASKLSGQAAIGWSLKFDKDAKRFASGVPQLGGYGKWVKVYDPRKDSTFPGGSGSHRLGIETTYEWSENAGLHAGTYAFGRFQNGKRTMGVGLPAEAIDWAAVAAWANVCDANEWTIFGPVFEPAPDTRWPNLKDICAAGGGRPIFAGGLLSFKYAAPRAVLDTFTEADLAGPPNGSVTAMTSRRSRINTVVPKYRSADHNWELVAAANAMSDAGYVAEDGEERRVEWPFNLVKDKDQAAQLAAYQIADSREIQPITLTFGHRVRAYRPGECVHLDIPSLALDHDAVILTRQFDPADLTTTFTFMSETGAKHDWALGRTAIAPPSPGLGQDGQTRDEQADAAAKPYGWQLALIRTAAILNPRDTSDVPRFLLIGTTTDPGGVSTVSVARHDWDYPDGIEGVADITRELGEVTGLAPATDYYLYFDDPDLDDTAPTYFATTDPAEGLNSSDHPDRHPLGKITTPAIGAGPTNGGPPPGYGWSAEANDTFAANFNARNDRIGTRPTRPAVLTDGTCVDHVINENGSVDLSFEWTFPIGEEAQIDGFEVALFASDSPGLHPIESLPGLAAIQMVPAYIRAFVWYGVQPTGYYTMGVRAYRVVDPDIDASQMLYSAWRQPSAAGENPYRPEIETEFDGDVIGTINGTSASNVASAVGNFNSRNDRMGGAIAEPTIVTTGAAVDHVLNQNGSVDISFEWSWAGDQNTIDGFEIMAYSAFISDERWPDSSDPNEGRTTVRPHTRGFILPGVDPTRYYTFAVRAFRAVDNDIAASGVIYSLWAKPSLSSENPYRPASSVAWPGNVIGTINGTSASNVATWSAYANNGLNPDGSVRPDKVVDGSILPGVINLAQYIYIGVQTIATVDGEAHENGPYGGATITTTAGGVIEAQAVFPFQLRLRDPDYGDVAGAVFKLVLHEWVGGTWLVPYESVPFPVTELWQGSSLTGLGDFPIRTKPIRVPFSIPSAGTWALGWEITGDPNTRWKVLQHFAKLDYKKALQ